MNCPYCGSVKLTERPCPKCGRAAAADVRYPEDDWPTEAEAWAFACGLSRGARENM